VSTINISTMGDEDPLVDVLTVHADDARYSDEEEEGVEDGDTRGRLTMGRRGGVNRRNGRDRVWNLTQAARTESELDTRFNGRKAVKPSFTTQLTSWAQGALPKEPVTIRSCIKNAGIIVGQLVPLVGWVSSYTREMVVPDVSAGLTVGIMLIPQAVAYGLLADLPLQYGLYAAIVPGAVYACMGTSRESHVGPMALVALLVSSSVDAIMSSGGLELDDLPPGELLEMRVETTMALTLTVGVIWFIFALLKLGFLVSFMAQPVIRGFTCGAAVLIGTSQLKHLFGLDLESKSFVSVVGELFEELGDVNGATILVGALCIFFLGVCRYINKTYKLKFPIPGELIALVVCTLVVGLARLDDPKGANVRVLGDIPSGLPVPKFPDFDACGASLDSFIMEGLLVAVISYIISASISKGFAIKNKYEVSMNQELVALGMAALLGALFSSYVPAGSLSRSSVAEGIGARTQLFSFISVVIVMVVALFLTEALFYLPYVVLASVILVSLTGLIMQLTGLPRLWRIFRDDFWMFVITFLATVFLGTTYGIVVGICFSFIVIFKQTARPHCCELGRLPGTNLYRSTIRFPSATQLDNILIFQFGSSLTFANKDYFLDSLNDALDARREELYGDQDSDVDLDGEEEDTYSDVELQGLSLELQSPRSVGGATAQQPSESAGSESVLDLHADAKAQRHPLPATNDRESSSSGANNKKKKKVASGSACKEGAKGTPDFIVILDCSSIVKFDSTAFDMLCDVMQENEVELYFASARGSLWELIRRAGSMSDCDLLDGIHVFVGVDKAVLHAESALQMEKKEKNEAHTADTQEKEEEEDEEARVMLTEEERGEGEDEQVASNAAQHNNAEDTTLMHRSVSFAGMARSQQRRPHNDRVSTLLSVDSVLDYKHFRAEVDHYFEEVTGDDHHFPPHRGHLLKSPQKKRKQRYFLQNKQPHVPLTRSPQRSNSTRERRTHSQPLRK
jgi:high affinity sulfate transporter 1